MFAARDQRPRGHACRRADRLPVLPDEIAVRNRHQREAVARRHVVEHLDDVGSDLHLRPARHGDLGDGDVVAGIDLDGVGGERCGLRSSGRHGDWWPLPAW